MLKKAMAVVVLLTMLVGLVAIPQPAVVRAQSAATSPDQVPPTYPPAQAFYFAETGHAAVNYFLEFWQNTPNALSILGFPISRPFIEESPTNPGNYYRVQYFERAVLEEHPENYGTQENRFYILGRLMGNLAAQGRENEQPFQRVADPGNGTWIEATGHTLTNSPAPFRNFWLNNGGLEVFGYPISEQFQEVNADDGQVYWVQYFERQRMEWHPENAAPFDVLLGLLGKEAQAANHSSNPAFRPGLARDSLPTQFVYGYNVHLYQDGSAWQDRKRVLEVSKNSQIYWVRQQIAWEDIQDRSGAIFWGELDDIVNDAHATGVNMLISVVRSPSWATPDGRNGMPSRENIGLFANFMGEMAARYRGKVQAYQVWNEPNLAVENGGRVANADFYVDMLYEAYNAIKAADPYAIVVSASPSATETNEPTVAISDVTFVRQMLNNPRFRADVIGTHPGGQNNPPDTLYPEDPGPNPGWDNSREFYFRRIQDIRQVMVETGYADRQIWLTEFGWATTNNTPGYEYGRDNSQEDQAEYIIRAFQIGRNEWAPWMGGMFLWNLNFSIPWAQYEGNPDHEQASFSVLNGDWSPRPAWYAIQAMPKD
ncbi:MAG: hypothetical protein HC914_06645 [Chloroflexaceae bacterium]|nr:hypothetical protein [Chloroflexaceae bacterium]